MEPAGQAAVYLADTARHVIMLVRLGLKEAPAGPGQPVSASIGVSVKTIEQGADTSVLLAASPLVQGLRAATSKIARRQNRINPAFAAALRRTRWIPSMR